MSKSRSAITSGKYIEAAPPGPVQAWVRFWFSPRDPTGLHAIRVLAGILFIAWLLPLAGNVEAMFGLQSWFDRQAYYDAARLPEEARPPITWSILYLCGSSAMLLKAM